jgi:hypothetical protein
MPNNGLLVASLSIPMLNQTGVCFAWLACYDITGDDIIKGGISMTKPHPVECRIYFVICALHIGRYPSKMIHLYGPHKSLWVHLPDKDKLTFMYLICW